MTPEERKVVVELINQYGFYIDLLGDELKKVAPFMLVHQMSFSQESIKKGKRYRDKIEELRNQLAVLLTN